MSPRLRTLAVLVGVIHCITCICVSAQVVGGNFNMHYDAFGTKEGLSQGLLRCIMQDKEGFMWFCTKDGLNRYDGYHVTVYRHNAGDRYSLPDNYVTSIVEDSKGLLWVGTNTKGLCVFDKKKERFYPVATAATADSLLNEEITYMEYANNRLCITWATAVCQYDITNVNPNQLAHLSPRELFNSRTFIASKGFQVKEPLNNKASSFDSVWVPDREKLFLCAKDKKSQQWQLFTLDYLQIGIPAEDVLHYVIKCGQNIVVTGGNQFTVCDMASGKFSQAKSFADYGINFHNWNSLDDDNVVIDGGGHGSIFNIKTLQDSKLSRTALPDNFALKYAARDGIAWIGTSGNGAYFHDSRKDHFRTCSHDNLFFNVDSQLNFTGQEGFGIGEFFTYNMLSGEKEPIRALHKYVIPSFVPQKRLHGTKNDMWLRTRDGSQGTFLQYNPIANAIKSYRTANLNNDQKSGVFDDHKGRSWFVPRRNNSKPEAYIVNNGTGEVTEYPFPISNDYNEYPFASDMLEDKDGIFWFGTLQGLFRFDEQRKQWRQWKNVPADTSSLNTDMIFSLCADPRYPEKYLWVGTNGGGLNRFEFATGKFVHYTVNDGLPNNVVYGILPDEAGNLWLSTNKGLTCFNPSLEAGTQGRFRTFTADDGIAGNEFNRYEYAKWRPDELLFGGVDGFTLFKPSEVLKHAPAPNIVLTGFSLFNKPFDYNTDTTIMNAPVGYASAIHLPYNKNMFTIEFAALDFSPPTKKHYKYILEHFNKEWIDNGANNTATFTNLDPGIYTFRVIAAIRDGEWSEHGPCITIVVMPPWWATWWFRTLAVVVVISAGYAFYRYRLRQALRLQLLRNDIASDLHDEIGSTLSSITLASTIMQKKVPGDQPESKALLEQISKNTDYMMEAMSDIVWAINTKNDRFENVVSRMLAFAIEILEPIDCELDFKADKSVDALVLNMAQRKNLYLIFKEAINNAAKYSGCKKVTVRLSLNTNKNLLLTIRDNGKGFDASWEEANQYSMGGNGLKNMYKRATELKGTLNVRSEPGKGTEVALTMPVSKKSLKSMSIN